MIKLSFTGDVSLDKPMLKASKCHDGQYRFDELFREVKPLFGNSDMVVGNLETVFGGADKGYNVKPFAYNSPDDFLYSLKNFGFNLFSVANNHCLDEGIDGLKRTVDICQRNDIDTVGMAAKPNYLIKNINGIKVAFISYTQMINQSPEVDKINGVENYVNILYPYKSVSAKGIKRIVYAIPLKYREGLKRLLGMPTVTKVTDTIQPNMLNEEFIQKLKLDIADAKSNADFVVILAHCGGQFNDSPGEYVNRIFDIMADAGADVIVGNHPHVIHKIDSSSHCIKAYSLGGFTLSPSAEYVHPDAMADYSMAIHLYIDEQNKKIMKGTFSIIHGIENHNKLLALQKMDFRQNNPCTSKLVHRVCGETVRKLAP